MIQTKSLHRLLPSGLALAFGLLGLVAWLNWKQTARMTETAELVSRSHEVTAELYQLLVLLDDIETGARGYVITGDSVFLEPFHAGVLAIKEQQRRVAQLATGEDLGADLSILEALIAQRTAVSQRNVDLRRNAGFDAARQEIAGGTGRRVMDQIRSTVSTMLVKEQARLDQRSAASKAEERTTTLYALTGTGLSCAILLGIFGLVLRENRMRRLTEADLTANKRELETALRSNQLIMEHSLDVICTIDGQGAFLFVSEASEKLLGFKAAELVGRRYVEFVHPDDRESSETAAAGLMKGQSLLGFENRYRRKDGSFVSLAWSASWSATENVMFCVAHDISTRKQAEAVIQSLNEDLRQRAAQLESSNKELEAFSYSVSHDLRAPLRHIDGFSAKLKRHLGPERLDETALRLLTTISDSARNMGRLIDDLLAFARIGRGELRRTPVQLAELVAECRRNLEGDLHGRVIVWEVGPLPTVEGDAGLLRQVFANLLGNAVKYTRRCPEARIEIGTQPGAAGEVVVFVRDNGAGFDMRYAGKLFGVFQRLHANAEFEGTGIGLANVRRIVERHGGSIGAEGAVDQGAVFCFRLPLAQRKAPAALS